MEFLQFLENSTQATAAALYVIGVFLKKINKFPDFLIPYTLIALGIILCIWTLGVSPNGVIQGILAAGEAVLINQCYKQASNALKD